MKQFYFFIFFPLTFFLICCEKPASQNNNKITMQSTNDLHSFANAQEVIMQHLTLDLTVDFEQKVLKGKAIIFFENLSQADEIILDTRDLKIEKVILENGEDANFRLEKNVKYLGQALKVDILPKTKSITVFYQTSQKAAALQWLNAQQTAGKQNPFLFTQSQAILARTWIPCQDSPGIRFTYDARIKVPNNLLAVMSASNPQEKNETGIYEFTMKQPIPAYLLALAVGDLTFLPISERAGVYAEPSMIESSVYEFADLEKMILRAEELYGKYAWERYDLLVLPPSFPFGGMENPRLTFATPTIIAGDRSLTSLVAHELAHSWSGNLVTNATWNDFWLNEGFTVYFERRIMESLYGESYAEMLAALGYQDMITTIEELGYAHIDTRLKLDLKGRNPDEGVTDIAYEKGYFFLKTIEQAVGREKFDAFLQKYFEENKFKSMNTENFVAYLNENLPEASSVGIDEWIYKTGLPNNCVTPQSSRFEAVEKEFEKWMNQGKTAKGLITKEWTAHEWLYFLRKLPKNTSLKQIEDLDKAFDFTNSGNAEIQTEWFVKVLPLQYEPAYAPAEEFLLQVGRRKFLVPIYKSWASTSVGKAKVMEVYGKARENYHYLAISTLDDMLSEISAEK